MYKVVAVIIVVKNMKVLKVDEAESKYVNDKSDDITVDGITVDDFIDDNNFECVFCVILVENITTGVDENDALKILFV